MRLAKDFKSSLKVLYCTSVRPVIKYGTINQDPKLVPRTLANSNVFRVDVFDLPAIFCPLFVLFVITIKLLFFLVQFLQLSVNAFRKQIFKKYCSGDVDSQPLLFLISFKVLQRFSRSTFHVLFSTTNYSSNEPIRRTRRLMDSVFNF